MPPLEPCQRSTVRRQSRGGVEVGALGNDPNLARGDVDRHELIHPLAMSGHDRRIVVLPYGIQPAPLDIVDHVGEPPGAIRRQRDDLARRHHTVEAPGREVGRDHEIARHEGRRAAIFVDAAAHVESLGRHPRDGPIALAPHQHLAPGFLGPTLEPPPRAPVSAHLAQEHDTVGQPLNRKRRFPAPVGRDDPVRHRSNQVPWRHEATYASCSDVIASRVMPIAASLSRATSASIASGTM